MIRFAFNYEANELKELWADVFGDSEEAIDMFFESHFIAENTVICSENSKIVAMFFLLQGKFVLNNQKYDSYYLYAACTNREYRGRGIMKNMIEFAENESKIRKIDYIFLLPAEESLYGYYERFGFIPVNGRKTNIYNFNELIISSETAIENKYSSEKLFDLRMKACSGYPYFEWDAKSIDFAIKFNEYYGGKSLINRNGYLLYTIDDETITVKENTFTDITESNLAHYLCNKHNCRKAAIISPCPKTQEGEKFGMVLPLSSVAKSIINEKRNVYLNLTLD